MPKIKRRPVKQARGAQAEAQIWARLLQLESLEEFKQRLMEKARDLLPAQAVLLLEGGERLAPSAWAFSPRLRQELTRGVLPNELLSAVKRVLTGGGPVALALPKGSFPAFGSRTEAMVSAVRREEPAVVLIAFLAPREHVGPVEERRWQSFFETASLMWSMVAEREKLRARSQEVERVLSIASALRVGGADLDTAIEEFLTAAAPLAGFQRAAVVVREEGNHRLRWLVDSGHARTLDLPFQSRLVEKILQSRSSFWSDQFAAAPDYEPAIASLFPGTQFLGVPLGGTDGQPLGVLALLDKVDRSSIGAHDLSSAQMLAGQLELALGAAQNFRISEQHRRRAGNLVQLARALGPALSLPDFVQSFTERVADIMDARCAVLALAQAGSLEVVASFPALPSGKAAQRKLALALGDYLQRRQEAIRSTSAAELVGLPMAEELGWSDITIARLSGADAELLGVICLAGLGRGLTSAEHELLQGLVGHGSVALDNARLFTRISQSSQQWAALFDAITDFIVVHDEQNRIVRLNRSLADFIGVHPAELIGVSMRALISLAAETGAQPCPLCRPGADDYIHPVLERTYLVSSSRLHDAPGAMQTVHVMKDITDRREAERRFHELFDSVQEGVYFSTPEGRFIEVNDALVRILGYNTREELLQVDIFKEIYFNPNDRRSFCEKAEQSTVLRNYEETLRRKNGSMIHTLQNAFVIRDAQGRVVQYRGVMLDITEAKRAQAQLQRERDFNSKILNNTQSLILVADTAGLVSYANRRCYDAGGYREDQLLGHRLLDIVAPSNRESLAHGVEEALQGRQTDNLELLLQRGDGSLGRFSVNLSPMRDEQEQVNSIVLVMTDITDAALMQAKLMHTEKMAAVGQLVSGVAHEVNNPLTAILGFADLLMENSGMPEAARADLKVIVQEAQRTKEIVQNLLSFARQSPPQRKPVSVNQVLRRTISLRAYDFSNHGVRVTERLLEDIPEVIGDTHQLQQVFLNVLNNAYDAVQETSRPGEIRIETETTDGFAEISFHDNGPGIQHPDRIFDPFFTTKPVGKGTGLGLSICYGIVREHGGEISCRNNEGGGATFCIRLPLAEIASEKPQAAGAQA